MSEKPPSQPVLGSGDGLRSLRSAARRARSRRSGSPVRDPWFRRAWALSAFLHVSLFVWVSLAPSQPKYRFFGSGTAVSLVGADEIPGGSAKGKSGDLPEALGRPAPKKKQAAPEKKAPARKVKKKKVSRTKRRPPRKKAVRKKTKPEKNVRHIRTKKSKVRKKKKVDPRRRARLRDIRARRARAAKWRRRFEKQKKAPKPKKAKKAVRPAPPAPPRGSPLGERVAKAQRPRVGYPGEGGGDGQGGGSLGGGSGGAARTELERYYGLLSERVRNNWTIPLTLKDVGGLRTEIILDISREGDVRNLEIARSSGNRVYDEAAMRAVARSVQPSAPAPPNTVRDPWLPLGFRFCGRNFCK